MKDLTLINGIRIEVGKSYWVQYIHCESKWEKVSISRLTDMGHPWANFKRSSGILTDDFRVQELTPEVELEQFARTWLDDKGYSGFAQHTPVPKWFAQMYHEFGPKN